LIGNTRGGIRSIGSISSSLRGRVRKVGKTVRRIFFRKLIMMNLHAIKLLYGGNILESYCGSFVVFIVASTVLPESSSQSS
jgi:hypothetical protein